MVQSERSRFYFKEKVHAFKNAALGCIPEEVADHLLNSQAEFLKAVRTVIDKQIASVERRRQKRSKRRNR